MFEYYIAMEEAMREKGLSESEIEKRMDEMIDLSNLVTWASL